MTETVNVYQPPTYEVADNIDLIRAVADMKRDEDDRDEMISEMRSANFEDSHGETDLERWERLSNKAGTL